MVVIYNLKWSSDFEEYTSCIVVSGEVIELDIGSGWERHTARYRKKRWKHNLDDWVGLNLGNSQRAVENMEIWRNLCVTPSVVPQ